MDREFITEVQGKVRDKPRLTPLFTSTQAIPERIHETNPRLFLCYNNVDGKFEVHSLDQEVSFCGQLPYKTLDARSLRWIWENDVRVHGKEIMRRIEQSELDYKKRMAKDHKNLVESVAKETRKLFAKDAFNAGV